MNNWEFSETDFPKRMEKIRKVMVENNRQWLRAPGSHGSSITAIEKVAPPSSTNEMEMMQRNREAANLRTNMANLTYNELGAVDPQPGFGTMSTAMALIVAKINEDRDILLQELTEKYKSPEVAANLMAQLPPSELQAQDFIRRAARVSENAARDASQLSTAEIQRTANEAEQIQLDNLEEKSLEPDLISVSSSDPFETPKAKEMALKKFGILNKKENSSSNESRRTQNASMQILSTLVNNSSSIKNGLDTVSAVGNAPPGFLAAENNVASQPSSAKVPPTPMQMTPQQLEMQMTPQQLEMTNTPNSAAASAKSAPNVEDQSDQVLRAQAQLFAAENMGIDEQKGSLILAKVLQSDPKVTEELARLKGNEVPSILNDLVKIYNDVARYQRVAKRQQEFFKKAKWYVESLQEAKRSFKRKQTSDYQLHLIVQKLETFFKLVYSLQTDRVFTEENKTPFLFRPEEEKIDFSGITGRNKERQDRMRFPPFTFENPPSSTTPYSKKAKGRGKKSLIGNFAPDKTPWSKAKVLDRIDLIVGMMENGNDNPALQVELETWLPYCVAHGILTKKKALSIAHRLR